MKQPKICERKRNGKTAFYCELNGKQHGLGTDREQAAILFADLLGKHHSQQEVTAPLSQWRRVISTACRLLRWERFW